VQGAQHGEHASNLHCAVAVAVAGAGAHAQQQGCTLAFSCFTNFCLTISSRCSSSATGSAYGSSGFQSGWSSVGNCGGFHPMAAPLLQCAAERNRRQVWTRAAPQENSNVVLPKLGRGLLNARARQGVHTWLLSASASGARGSGYGSRTLTSQDELKGKWTAWNT